MNVIGIDPGIGGAIALLRASAPPCTFHMPTIAAGKKSGKRAVDHWELASLFRNMVRETSGQIVAVIEDVHAMPGQGVTSMFSFGRGLGRIEGVLAALGVSCEYVTPATWKAYYKLGRDKEQARMLARQFWPDIPLGKKKDHGMAEAMLIARWRLRPEAIAIIEGRA